MTSEKEETKNALLEELENLGHTFDTLQMLALQIKPSSFIQNYQEESLKMFLEIWHRKAESQSELEDIPESIRKIGELLAKLEKIISEEENKKG